MTGQIPLEPVIEIWDIGSVKCACGCGEEAEQVYLGVPVAMENPVTHYIDYMGRKSSHIEP